MTITTLSAVIENQKNLIFNPNRMQEYSLNLFESLYNGQDNILTDPSNPFIYALEMAATAATTAAITAENLARKMYPEMATKQEDVYLHMVDNDYVGRFAMPSEKIWTFTMTVDEIKSLAKPINGGGSSAIVIPKHTEVRVGDYYYTTQYPVVINVMYNGTISVHMDVSKASPVYMPPTNKLNWFMYRHSDDLQYLLIDIPMQQVRVTSQVMQVISFTGYAKAITFTDNYCHCRAFIKDRYNNWIEIRTTHNNQVYNPEIPTVCLNVVDNQLNIYIPQIYFERGSIRDVIRLDLYTTKGDVIPDFSTIRLEDIKYTFRDYDNENLDRLSAPLNSFTRFSILNKGGSSGGRKAMSFPELKRRVVNRSTTVAGLPITTNQLGSSLKELGYTLITTLDNITQRQYTAVRDVEPPDDSSTVTGLSCCIQNVETTIFDVKNSWDYIFNSTKRSTLTPNALFSTEDGYIKLLSKTETDKLKDLASISPDGIANYLNQTQHYYTPFHYVFDTNNDVMEIRPYYMDSPIINNRYRQNQNLVLGIDIQSEVFMIYPKNDSTNGYYLVMRLKNTETLGAFQAHQVLTQLSFTPVGSKRRGFIEGKLISPIDSTTNQPVDNIWEFRFPIETNYDINERHELYISNAGYFARLKHDFDVVIMVKDYLPTGASAGPIDSLYTTTKISNYNALDTYIGATHETIEIEFGQYLKHLWRRSRTVVAETEYQRWEVDVVDTYKETIYKTDANGNIVIEYDHATNEISYTKLHDKGDQILDEDGNPVYLHRKGDIRLDERGNPIPIKSNDTLARLVDLFLIDGRYYFANSDLTVNYIQKSMNKINEWITKEISSFNERLLERTDLYYHPRNNVGLIDVVVGDNVSVRTKANRSINVTYTLSKEKSLNAELTASLRAKTPSIVVKAINELITTNDGILSLNDLNNKIKSMLDFNDIYDVHVEGYFIDGYDSMITTDITSIPSIGKKLVAQTNMVLGVEDDVTVSFNVLDRSQLYKVLGNKV